MLYTINSIIYLNESFSNDLRMPLTKNKYSKFSIIQEKFIKMEFFNNLFLHIINHVINHYDCCN